MSGLRGPGKFVGRGLRGARDRSCGLGDFVIRVVSRGSVVPGGVVRGKGAWPGGVVPGPRRLGAWAGGSRGLGGSWPGAVSWWPA
jgi:hypothetical protein